MKNSDLFVLFDCGINNRSRKEKEKLQVQVWKMIWSFCGCLSFIGYICCICGVNLVIMIIWSLSIGKNKGVEENGFYRYKMISYDLKSNEKIEGVVERDKMVRGYSFYDDEEGISGYVYPINMINQEEEGETFYEYKIEGECNCCVECVNDDNCKSGLVCRDSICVECNNLNDCNENQVCNEYGKCLKSGSCGSNDDCNKNEYCNLIGECVNGCIKDKNCKYNEMCIDSQCISIGCNDNFDCNDYDHVCIDNECVLFDDNTDTCLNDNDCRDYDGFYCNYEYLICVKDNRIGTIMERRNSEVLPVAAACSFYGMISLFVLISSQSIISNLGKDKLKNECDKQCSNYYQMSSIGKVGNYQYTEEHQLEKWNKRNSECTGKCRPSNRVNYEDAVDHANLFCPKQSYTSIVTVDQKSWLTESNGRTQTLSYHIFVKLLSVHCKKFFYNYEYEYFHTKNRKFYSQIRSPIVCSADKSSIKCNVI